jgi:hypothetical protein
LLGLNPRNATANRCFGSSNARFSISATYRALSPAEMPIMNASVIASPPAAAKAAS